MAKRVLSIETGAWWTKVVLAQPYKKSSQILDLFYFRTPDRTVEDGMIRDRERFLAALKEELAKHHITEKNVIFTINSTKVITRDMAIPFVKDKQLPGIVAVSANDYFPMDVSGYTITYKKMDEYTEDGKKMLRLLLIAVPDTLLNGYTAFAKSAGFTVESFEYIGNSVLSYAKAHYTVDSVIIQLEENETIISIMMGKKLMFQRVAPNGYASTLATVLEHPVLNVSDEPEAYHFLTTHNVLYKKPRLTEVKTPEDESRQRALEDAYADIKEALGYHIRVVMTALEYYRNQSKKDFYGVMRIVGDGARIAGIKKLFTDEVALELAEEEPFANVHLSRNVNREEAMEVDFTSAIGALISPLNIKPKETAAKESKQNTLRVAYLAFAGSAVISLALVGSGVLRYMQAADEHDRLTRRIQELSYIQQIYDEHEAIKAQTAEFITFDLMTWTDNEMALNLVRGLEEQLPDTVRVLNLSLNGNNITMNLTSPDELTVAQMLLNVQDIPCLGEVSVPNISETVDEAGNIVWNYSVVAVYQNPSETSLADRLNQLDPLESTAGTGNAQETE